MDADLHHGLGLFLFLPVAHYLGRKLAGRNYLVPAEIEWRLGIHRANPRDPPVRSFLCPLAFAPIQTRHTPPGLACSLDHDHALYGSFLDHRTEFLENADRDTRRYCRPGRPRRDLAGVLLPQSECFATRARI